MTKGALRMTEGRGDGMGVFEGALGVLTITLLSPWSDCRRVWVDPGGPFAVTNGL